MHRFSGQILHALQQVNGDVRLNIPNIVIEDPSSVTEDEKVCRICGSYWRLTVVLDFIGDRGGCGRMDTYNSSSS